MLVEILIWLLYNKSKGGIVLKRIILTFISVLLVLSMLAGCGGVKAKNLMKNITAQPVDGIDDMSCGNVAVTDFAVRLFKECEQSGQNTLVSPVSVMYALAMTANGADGDTLSQMETVLGMPIEDLNEYLYSYNKSLAQGEKYKLSFANSIWVNDISDFNANEDFLQTNANYYGADIYKTTFNKRTAKDINNWVTDKTDEMIPEIIDNIDSDAVMYLINTLMFEAEWDSGYKQQKVEQGIFTREDGVQQTVEFMNSCEYNYISDQNAEGFIKHYYSDKYAFVALKPNQNITVSEYINSLDGESINKMLLNAENTRVLCSLPKFEYEYDISLKDALKRMGIQDAFDDNKANLSKLGSAATGNLYIDDALHKTFISLDEKGTSAGAATVVTIVKKSIPMAEKTVYLDRPFVYMIIDSTNNVPLFIGSVMSLEN